MKVTNAEYMASAYLSSQFPSEMYPEISFIGRSNVGKSSLINTLINRKNLAYTSKQPGKTRTINFFLINKSLYFVDLPGYGFAKVSKTMQKDWEQLVNAYLSQRNTLKLSILIIDGRHGPKDADIDMFDYLLDFERPVLLVATKMDKVKANKRKQRITEMRSALELDQDDELITFSSATGEGKNELWQIIEDLL
ncbi:ribosome biogenesis GTP-binding protein YihA/YsxC [Natranaerobius thermophilus]|uniref:Probable GTP-binding protein EngB n=1 Tax=Natranaerobius thermophilus (strain ATCC BAA-1301 / DSM 18059 / JW/NM-WN-LF) TaxID=457570 RepID=ENGB_NATTJ|nr:ribosome biogenesis GTP-binding protein YihA/YsxC [Natranaerobius thermophilus]B2A1E8.1 RecName: Full=Probable GTP-binding protein EngB [Natranaerobius thermophilus JW/NM-WN-LF]ACB84688.1 GTP-binding protein HSR1-related [Natranaerobius thermophilus JW/NM-WN-LF]